MPELPEVETTLQGIMPYLLNQKIKAVAVHQASLRWPIDVAELTRAIVGRAFLRLSRRGKYLLFDNDQGTMLCHLGMSGSLRISINNEPRRKHDHVEWWMQSGIVMRFHDPRRFGCVLWTESAENHHLLSPLGPEPLSAKFNADYLFDCSRSRKRAVKTFIMDSRVVVGVGNIYANEALFMAGIHPARKAGNISRSRYQRLVESIKVVLRQSIESGGTTLQDFVNADGKPGYFKQQLNVYARSGQCCRHCRAPIKRVMQGQRSTYYCPKCQT